MNEETAAELTRDIIIRAGKFIDNDKVLADTPEFYKMMDDINDMLLSADDS